MKILKHRMMESILVTAFLFAFSPALHAQYNFTTNSDGSLNISAYTGSDNALTIPDTFYNLPITTIGDNAFHLAAMSSLSMGSNIVTVGNGTFSSCFFLKTVSLGTNITQIGNGAFLNDSVLRSITLPDSVSIIGNNVFFSCPKLANVILGASLTSIPTASFQSCSSLTNVDIGPSVTNIADGAFGQCPLQAINVDPQNQFFCSVNGVLFDKAQTELIVFPVGQRPVTYTIPDSVVTIADDAFYNCSSLATLTLPDHVAVLGTAAFSACSGLTNVSFGKSVAYVGDAAFQGCSGLTAVTLPNSLTNIAQYAFYSCGALLNVTIGTGIQTIVGGAFLSCPSLQGVYFQGNAPSSSESFSGDNAAVAYYLPGTSGWGPRFGDPYGLPTAVWWLPYPTILSFESNFGLQTNQFGFTIAWATNGSVLVDVCTNLSAPVWAPISTNTLINGSSYFGDPQWMNYPSRFYRLRSP
ncbi:MAG TPA: leucine-rich repeat domain-containing protein [Verrucomicrobiae bacterium]|nr:leucine-rich repeat domain-containing protein [Verrucomicrobiae bacterium]